jgi:predicted PurR-regulated permease PerM
MAIAPAATARNAMVVIAVIVTGAALRWMGDIITPLLLAIFLAIMVDGFGRVIRRRIPLMPQGGAVTAALLISGVLLIAIAVIVADNAGGFIGNLSTYEPRLNALIARVATSLGLKAQSIDQIIGQLDPTPYLGFAAQQLLGLASTALLVFIYLGFLIASRHAFERKAVKLFAEREERQEAVQLFLRIKDGIESYLWIQTVLGLVIAAGSWAVMMVLGLNDALFWAFLIFVVNYVPIVGAVVAIAAPALFALVQFDSFGRAAILLGALFAITFVVGNILLPRMQGSSLNMDPLVVLLSLAFWGALWGLAGMFLSTPLTVLAMMILAQFDGSRWIAVLLSADGDPQGLRPSHRSIAASAAAPKAATP